MWFFFVFFAIDRNLSTVKLNVAIIKEYQDKKINFLYLLILILYYSLLFFINDYYCNRSSVIVIDYQPFHQ